MMDDNNILAKKFDLKSLISYSLPTILMMLFMSTYTIVDGIFVAEFIGELAISAINIVVPAFNLMLAVGLMLGSGGVAIIGRMMGEGRYQEARSFLSTTYVVGGVIALIISTLGFIFADEVVLFLGANETLFPLAKDYFLSINLFVLTMCFQMFVQTFFVTAGKPELGFLICVSGGITNMVLDYFFMSPNFLNLGIAGAGLATGMGSLVTAAIGFFYFLFMRKGTLYFEKPIFDFKLILESAFNGSSEMVSNLSVAVTTILLNLTLMQISGEQGVAAISVILYIQMIQVAIYGGYSMGVAPILSYKYGNEDHKQLKKVVTTSLKLIFVASLVVVALSLIFVNQAVGIFIETSSPTFALAREGFIIFSFAYLFMGINFFLSGLFTSLSNGKVSAGLSIIRTLILPIVLIFTLPRFLGVVGVWLVIPVAELIASIIGYYAFRKNREYYHY